MYGTTVKYLPAAEAQGARTFSVLTYDTCDTCGKNLNATEVANDRCDKCKCHGYNKPVVDENPNE